MKNSIFLLSFALCYLFSDTCEAQTQFQWAIGGTGYDEAYSIIQTTDGGYAVAGVTYSFGGGSSDMYIVKLDASGTLQWRKTVGGTGCYGKSIIQTTDGGYAAAGYTSSFGAGNYDVYIVKLDGSGTLQWSRTVGGTGIDAARSIIQTTDGGYAVAGLTNSFGVGGRDFYIVKLDGSGTLQWNRTVGGIYFDEAYSIIQTTDGGYAAAGYTAFFGGGGDFYIIKLDGSGTLLWDKTVGGTGVGGARSIRQTIDSGYAVAGLTNSFGVGSYDFYIVKLDGSGALLWSKTVGETSIDIAYSIIQTTDDGYAVAGGTYSFGAGNTDIYIVKLDGSGNTCGNTFTPSSISGSGGTLRSPTSTTSSPTPTVTTPSPTIGTGGTLTLPALNRFQMNSQIRMNYSRTIPILSIRKQLLVIS